MGGDSKTQLAPSRAVDERGAFLHGDLAFKKIIKRSRQGHAQRSEKGGRRKQGIAHENLVRAARRQRQATGAGERGKSRATAGSFAFFGSARGKLLLREASAADALGGGEGGGGDSRNPLKLSLFFPYSIFFLFFLNIRLKINVVITLLWTWRSPAASLRPVDFIPRAAIVWRMGMRCWLLDDVFLYSFSRLFFPVFFVGLVEFL